MNRYDLIDLTTRERIKGVLGTPRLISEATEPGARVQAYRMGEAMPKYPGGLWRVREDAYDQRHGVTQDQYRTVRMEVVDTAGTCPRCRS